MSQGTILDIKFHREGDTLYLDGYNRVFMNLGDVPFDDGDTIVEKGDVTGTLSDIYRVRFLYSEGMDPGDSMTRVQMLWMAVAAANEAFNNELNLHEDGSEGPLYKVA